MFDDLFKWGYYMITLNVEANIWEISSDTHQLQLIKRHHIKIERFQSI